MKVITNFLCVAGRVSQITNNPLHLIIYDFLTWLKAINEMGFTIDPHNVDK